jgi:hypothetical protein
VAVRAHFEVYRHLQDGIRLADKFGQRPFLGVVRRELVLWRSELIAVNQNGSAFSCVEYPSASNLTPNALKITPPKDWVNQILERFFRRESKLFSKV